MAETIDRVNRDRNSLMTWESEADWFRPENDRTNWLRDIARALWRRRRIGLAFASFLFGLSLAAALLMENSYRSEASVFVKLGRESVALDPTVTTMQTITVNETREVEINSILETLKSREIAQKLVDEFGADAILAGVLPGDGEGIESSWLSNLMGGTIDGLRQFNDGRVVTPRERATRRLMKNFDVTTPKKTTVIRMQYEAKTPQMAQRVLERLIEVFQQEHVRINRTAGSYDFLAAQRELLEGKLNDAEDAMRTAKNRMGLVSIEGGRRKLQDEIAILSQQLINASSDLAAAKSKMDSLRESIVTIPDRLQTADVSGLPNEATDRMRETLYQLQIREKELLTQFTESHPRLLQIQKQLSQAEAVYNQQGMEREQSTTAVHPSKQQLELLYLTEKAAVASLTGRIDSLETQTQLARAELLELNENEIELAQLQRQINLAEHSLRGYSDRLEQSRLDRELQSQRISNVNVLQPAMFLEKPASPPRLMILVGGFCFAIIGGFGSALLADTFFLALGVSATSASVSTGKSIPEYRTHPAHASTFNMAEPSTHDVQKAI